MSTVMTASAAPGLGRPGLDRLRDHAALADLDVVLVTAPDRLARNYVHQVLLIEESVTPASPTWTRPLLSR
jgi:DNA invertase Pin-like site-specific DNA recombinase